MKVSITNIIATTNS